MRTPSFFAKENITHAHLLLSQKIVIFFRVAITFLITLAPSTERLWLRIPPSSLCTLSCSPRTCKFHRCHNFLRIFSRTLCTPIQSPVLYGLLGSLSCIPLICDGGNS